MPDNCGFIDVHTHKLKSNGSDLTVCNLFPGETIPYAPQGLFFSVGFHPWYLDGWESQFNRFVHNINDNHIIAIGECGFDVFSKHGFAMQEKAFNQQAQLSEVLQKPLIVHCVKEYHVLLHIRKLSGYITPWVLHGFGANLQIAKQCIRHGMYLSFGKLLFTPNSHSVAVAKEIDLQYVFLETDDSNYSISDIYNRFAEIRNIPLNDVKYSVFANFKRVFNK